MRASRLIDQYSEAVTQGRSAKIIILKKLNENTCTKIAFSIHLEALGLRGKERSSNWRCSRKTVHLKISQNSKKKTCARASSFNKVAPCDFIKNSTLAQAFSVKFTKSLWTTFLQNTSGRLLHLLVPLLIKKLPAEKAIQIQQILFFLTKIQNKEYTYLFPYSLTTVLYTYKMELIYKISHFL